MTQQPGDRRFPYRPRGEGLLAQPYTQRVLALYDILVDRAREADEDATARAKDLIGRVPAAAVTSELAVKVVQDAVAGGAMCGEALGLFTAATILWEMFPEIRGVRQAPKPVLQGAGLPLTTLAGPKAAEGSADERG